MSRHGQYISLVLMLVSMLSSVYFYKSWHDDNGQLREIVLNQTTSTMSDAERIIKLTEHVYSSKGFEKNKGYFLIKELGPTPVNVLESGGDCADKSRLLSAMLQQAGIRSTLAMLHPCKKCPADHTVVEAESETGWMVVDPVFNLWFTKPPNEYYGENYLGLKDLKDNPNILRDRLRYLRGIRNPRDKIIHYKDDIMIYSYARTINWDKNIFTRFISGVIRISGTDPYLMHRPYWMEDPKLALTLLSSVATICLFILCVFFRHRARQGKPNPA